MAHLDSEQDLDRGHDYEPTTGGTQRRGARPGGQSASARLSRPERPTPSGLIQRKASGGGAGSGDVEATIAADAEAAVAAAAPETSGAGGEALPADLRERFETSLGADLGDVRIHTGGASQAATGAVSAHAYAQGNDIHFAEGQYDPGSESGQRLLAHEVAHTVQQRGGAATRQHKLAVSSASDGFELEADRAAEAMLTGAPAPLTSTTGGVVARKEAPAKPAGTARPLTAEDKNHLANAAKLLAAAHKNLATVQGALKTYGKEAPELLSTIKGNYDSLAGVYKTQYERVNDVIKKAKEIYQLQMTMLSTVVDAAVGPLVKELTRITTSTNACYSALSNGEKAVIDSVRNASAFDALASFRSAAAKDTSGLTEQAVDAGKNEIKKQGGGATDGAGPADGGELQTAFTASFSAMQSKALRLLPIATSVADLSGALGKATGFLDGIMGDTKTRPGSLPADLDLQAAVILNGTMALAGAGSFTDTALSQLRGAVKSGATLKPKNDVEIQKELWIKWAGGLGPGGTDLLDLDVIEDHLKRLGVWDQLGIEQGSYMSEDDEALAVVSAKAASMIMAHKGAIVTVPNSRGTVSCVLDGLGEVKAVLESKPVDEDEPNVRAMVISTVTTGTLSHDVLKPREKNLIARGLIGDGLVRAVLRPMSDY